MGWKIILAIVVVLGLLAAKSFYDDKVYRKRLRGRMKREWGKLSREEYPPEKMDYISGYYQDKREESDIDDITWNDLNMDRIYQQINHTQSAMGQEYLYAMLRKPVLEPKELEERERLIKYFTTKEEERIQLQVHLSVMGKIGKFSVYRYLKNVRKLKPVSSAGQIFQMLLLIVSIISCLFWPATMILPTIIVVIYNMITYYKRKGEMDHYYYLFGYIVRTVKFCRDLSKLSVKGLEKYQNELGENAKVFDGFCRFSWLVVGCGDMSGSLLDGIIDYIRMLFHIDIIKFQKMAKDVVKNENQLLRLYQIIGYIDSIITVASYRQYVQDWCVPELLQEGKPVFQAEQMYHPLVEDPVKNTILEEKSVLLTGSNASGKSTFIKAAAVNGILAQTIHTVMASSYRATYFRIYSSMALRDDLMSQESYYIVEIKSLKRIVDQAKKEGIPVLCFIDEVLRGTNTLERIAASSRILAILAQSNALCFAATHDIELTNILESYYNNYHFEERVEADDVLFDYQLRKGRAMTRNAIKLLGMIGYDSQIIQQAEESVQGFLESGVWQKL